jgi:nickel/cobalt transporter (NiCoT) family protein
MIEIFKAVVGGRAGKRRSIAAVFLGLVLLNLGAWIWALVVFRDHPLLLGTALLAYGFGLRHAFDADHIAAIDNVTRRLMQDSQRPVAVGLYFALGHSTVVILVAAAIAATASALTAHFGQTARSIGGIVSTSVSATFLLVLAVMNLMIFRAVWLTFRRVRAGGVYDEDDFDLLLNKRGFAARLFRPLFRLIRRSWHMYPLGLLFGLGFDTATEVALLGISATEAAKGTSWWVIMVFPVLFAAGMSLMDTTDGVLMLGAYDWAFVKPVRKLFYNMTITLVSVVIALLVGGVEALGLLTEQLHLSGAFWGAIARLNGNFGTLGFIIVAVFIFAWVVSVIIYRYKGYEQLELARR